MSLCILAHKADHFSNLPESLLLQSSTPLMSMTSLGLSEGKSTSQLGCLRDFCFSITIISFYEWKPRIVVGKSYHAM